VAYGQRSGQSQHSFVEQQQTQNEVAVTTGSYAKHVGAIIWRGGESVGEESSRVLVVGVLVS
jgi:hypothetical protein